MCCYQTACLFGRMVRKLNLPLVVICDHLDRTETWIVTWIVLHIEFSSLDSFEKKRKVQTVVTVSHNSFDLWFRI
jgi:hypothetical protein